MRETAQLLHLACVVGGDLTSGAGDAETVEELEKIAADGRDKVAGLALAGGFLAQLVKCVCACREVSLTEAISELLGERGVRRRCGPHRRRR